MSATSPGFPQSAAALVEELNRTGFVCLENAVDQDWLERARSHIKSLLNTHGERFFSIVRPGDESGSPAREMASDPQLHRLIRDLTLSACPRGVEPGADIYNVLRIIAGPKSEEGSLLFHYDASVVTALVPIFMPANELRPCGELVTFPNRRPFRRSAAVNLIEKLLVQNRWSRRRAKRTFDAAPDDHLQLLHPGNIYLFWGYRTYHGNLPSAPNSLRATMLLHYGNPHGDNLALRTLRSGRRIVETLRLKRA
jgi:hypothetical protein